MATKGYNLEQTGEQVQAALNKAINLGPATEETDGLMTATDKASLEHLNSVIDTKVDKVTGKGLSTNDFTNEEKDKLDTAYQVPSTGIPAADLSSGVQTSLGKANSAVQPADLVPITEKIPAQASAQNQLADKAFVNSSISTASADFKGTYDSLAELQAVTADKNDYGYVVSTDEAGNTVYSRYKYNGSSWVFEYDLNNSSFTAAEWASIQSQITAALVQKLSALPTNQELGQSLSGKQDVITDLATIRSGAAAGATAYQKPGTGIPSSDMASGVQTSLGKADTAYQKPGTGIPASDLASGVIPDVSGKQDTLVSGTNIKTVNGESILGSGDITAGDPNAVKYVAQTLTDAQKTQARTNIGAAAASAISSLETAIAAKYSKPSGGIPKADLASGVQDSLDLADSALQYTPSGEIDPEITPADYATREELAELEAKVDNLGGVNENTTPVWTQGKRLNESGQVINSGNQLYISDFIAVHPGTTTIIHGARDYAALQMPCALFYNEAKTSVLGYKYGQGDVDISTELANLNPAYIRLSHYDNGDTLPVTGVYVTAYLAPTLATPQYVQDTVQDAIDEVPVVTTARNTQYPDLMEGYRASVNGYYLTNGVPTANANWCSMTDYLPVEAAKTYAMARHYKQGMGNLQMNVCYYKSDKTYISSEIKTMNSGFTTPANTAYIRVSVTNTNFYADGEDNFDNIYMEEAADGYSVHTIDTAEVVTNGYPKTPLYGKGWAVFGDSITEKNFRSTLNYHDYIRSEMNVLVTNFGLGGSGYKNRDDNGKAFYQLIYQNRDALKDFDLITVMGGVNDCTRGTFASIIGTIDDEFSGSDYSGVTSNTIFACFKKSIELIFQYAPLVHIAIISPLPAVTGGFTFNPDDDTNNMSVFVSGCKQICERYGIPYLDLYHTSGLRPWDDTVNNNFFRCISADSPDRLHPNEYGHKWFYPQVREFIKKLI